MYMVLIFICQFLSSVWGAHSWCVVTVIQAFVWDACKDLTLIILMVAAAVSLALGIYTEVCITSLVLLFLTSELVQHNFSFCMST